MAKAGRLAPFSSLMLLGRYAERFGRNPDDVFWDTSFNAVINFAIAWKEEDEFQERFNYLWSEIHQVPTKAKS